MSLCYSQTLSYSVFGVEKGNRVPVKTNFVQRNVVNLYVSRLSYNNSILCPMFETGHGTINNYSHLSSKLTKKINRSNQ